MNLKAHLSKLQDLLSPYQNIWGQEIIHHFESGLGDYPQEWLNNIAQLSHYDLWQLDCNHLPEHLGSPLKELFINLESASLQPQLAQAVVDHFDPKLFFKVKGKKYHEVCSVLNLLCDSSTPNLKKLIDIGAGQGHLTRICSEKLGLKSHAIEQNSEFIQLGLERLKNSPLQNPHASLSFHQQVFGDSKSLSPLVEEKGLNTALLGLHTCGPLAIDQMKASLDYPRLLNINIPCCYQKIRDLKLCNLSGHVHLPWTPYALTLASRAHGSISYSDFCHKERVKYYRYALHWFLLEFYKRADFQSVGDSPGRDYRASFSTYLDLKLKYLKLDRKRINHLDPQSWYLSSPVQTKLRQLFLANLIRWRFGQALEQVLLLDRALWMQEQGFNVRIERIFDPTISPRAHSITLLPRVD